MPWQYKNSMAATHNLEAPSSKPAPLHGNDGIESPFWKTMLHSAKVMSPDLAPSTFGKAQEDQGLRFCAGEQSWLDKCLVSDDIRSAST